MLVGSGKLLGPDPSSIYLGPKVITWDLTVPQVHSVRVYICIYTNLYLLGAAPTQ